VGLHDLSRSPSISLLAKQHHSVPCALEKTTLKLHTTRFAQNPLVLEILSPDTETRSARAFESSVAKRATHTSDECHRIDSAKSQQSYLDDSTTDSLDTLRHTLHSIQRSSPRKHLSSPAQEANTSTTHTATEVKSGAVVLEAWREGQGATRAFLVTQENKSWACRSRLGRV
jgi:hypothetical protein